MVAKISKGSSLHGALSYNQDKVKEQQAKILLSNRVMLNSDGTVNMYLANLSFAPYLNANLNTEKPVLHISINPHPDDKVSDDMYSDIAQTYMQKMGFGEQPYIVYKHEDLDRQHIHIVTVNVDENGKKLDDSNNFYQSKKITRELEKTYNLHTAEKKKQDHDLSKIKRVDYQSGDIKKQVGNTVKGLIKSFKFQSVNEYKALLSVYGITVEEVKGEIKGKKYNGLVYSALDDKGQKVGTPIKASAIGKSVGYDALQSRIDYSIKQGKDKPIYKSAKKIISSAMEKHSNQTGFIDELSKNGLTAILRTNTEGRIYGATFIDFQNRIVFNGSRIGKEFSANVFNEHFSKPNEQQLTSTNIESSNAGSQDKLEQQDFQPEQPSDNNIIPTLLEQHGTDYDAESFARQKEAESKKRRYLANRGFKQ
mgnify:CR=1 FL=1